MNRHVVPVTLFLALLAGDPVAAHAQNQWAQDVKGQVERYGAELVQQGYVLQGTPSIGALEANKWRDIPFTLVRGKDYAFLGVCDEDCGDIDLRLLDPDSTELATDYEKDKHPIVRVAGARDGTYTVHVYMSLCATEPCFYGVGVYVRPSRPDREEPDGNRDRGAGASPTAVPPAPSTSPARTPAAVPRTRV